LYNLRHFPSNFATIIPTQLQDRLIIQLGGKKDVLMTSFKLTTIYITIYYHREAICLGEEMKAALVEAFSSSLPRFGACPFIRVG
jgi:hypothetical protein